MNVNIPTLETEDRSAKIMLGNTEYELILSTYATKAISRRYGGLQNLGEKLSNSSQFEEVIGEIVWLITLLANQSIMIWNLWHPDQKRALLTEEAVELLSTPYELAEYKDAIIVAMNKGTKRYVRSEETEAKKETAE